MANLDERFVADALVGGRFARVFEAIAGVGFPSEAMSSSERASLYLHERQKSHSQDGLVTRRFCD
jgi:hypothetical protein